MWARRIIIRICLISSLIVAVWTGSALTHELVIFLDPRGSDSFDGLSERTPVASLQEAIRIAELLSDKGVSLVRVSVAAGEYRGQAVKASGNMAGLRIAVTAADPNQSRPRFNGVPHGGTWLDVRSATGEPPTFMISWLEIANYETAINLAGDRNNRERSNSGNEIRNNVFTNIGQIARPGALPSTAVIRLVNADDNVIASNRFVHIVNLEGCARLHSIYVAHDSTGNEISDNVFEDSCGDAIRFRDGSHSNLVKNNTFIDAWAKAPVSDWYCDSRGRNDCTKATPECPSMNNVLDGNLVVARHLTPTPSFWAFGEDVRRNCATYLNGKRFEIR